MKNFIQIRQSLLYELVSINKKKNINTTGDIQKQRSRDSHAVCDTPLTDNCYYKPSDQKQNNCYTKNKQYFNSKKQDSLNTKIKHNISKTINQKQFQAQNIYRKLKIEESEKSIKTKYVHLKRKNKIGNKQNLKNYHLQKNQKNKIPYTHTLHDISNFRNIPRGSIVLKNNLEQLILCCNQKLIKNDWIYKPITIFLQQNIKCNYLQILVEKPIKLNKKTAKQQIQQFQAKILSINEQFENQALSEDFKRQHQYFLIPNYNCYIQTNQLYISWIQRALVIDWIMQALTQFGSKRQTFAKAVSILDRFLAVTFNIELNKLQLVGASSMLIANKLEDCIFSLNNLYELVSESYTINQIEQMQSQILRKLKWKLNPPTSNSWANRLATQWDLYLQASQTKNRYQIIQNNLKILKFKLSDNDSYYNYRWLMQYIDFSILDIHTLQYQGSTLAASFIYLVLLQRLQIYSKEKIIEKFPTSSMYLLNEALDSTKFNRFFDQFLSFSFSITLVDLLPTIQYCSTFVILQLNFDLPPAVQSNEQGQLHYEQFCSFQTRNKYNTSFLQRRNRQYD